MEYVFGVSSVFGYVFDKVGFYFVVEFCFNFFVVGVVSVCLVCIVYWVDVDECDF